MPDHPHFAQRLAAAGYRNGYFGKWHVEGTGKLDDFGWHESDQRCGGAPHKTLPGSELWVKTPGYRNYMLAGASADEGCLQHPAFRPMPLRFAVGNDFVLKLAVVFGSPVRAVFVDALIGFSLRRLPPWGCCPDHGNVTRVRGLTTITFRDAGLPVASIHSSVTGPACARRNSADPREEFTQTRNEADSSHGACQAQGHRHAFTTMSASQPSRETSWNPSPKFCDF